jgi:hypothetical protein
MKVALLCLVAVVGCGNVSEPLTCAHTGHESLPLLLHTANPDSSSVVQDSISADPPCVVGEPWIIGDQVAGSCVCMD